MAINVILTLVHTSNTFFTKLISLLSSQQCTPFYSHYIEEFVDNKSLFYF